MEKIRRHKEALQTIVAGVEEFNRDIEQEKLEKGETVDEVKEAKEGLLYFWFRFAKYTGPPNDNFRNICCKIFCLPAFPRIFEHQKIGIIAHF